MLAIIEGSWTALTQDSATLGVINKNVVQPVKNGVVKVVSKVTAVVEKAIP